MKTDISKQAEFLKRLAILADICRHTLDEYQVELYDSELKPRGYGPLCKAIDRLMVTRKSNSPFPSVAELKTLVPMIVEEEIRRGTCGACNDGIVFAAPKGTEYPRYIFKCSCEFGTGRPENYAIWNNGPNLEVLK